MTSQKRSHSNQPKNETTKTMVYYSTISCRSFHQFSFIIIQFSFIIIMKVLINLLVNIPSGCIQFGRRISKLISESNYKLKFVHDVQVRWTINTYTSCLADYVCSCRQVEVWWYWSMYRNGAQAILVWWLPATAAASCVVVCMYSSSEGSTSYSNTMVSFLVSRLFSLSLSVSSFVRCFSSTQRRVMICDALCLLKYYIYLFFWRHTYTVDHYFSIIIYCTMTPSFPTTTAGHATQYNTKVPTFFSKSICENNFW